MSLIRSSILLPSKHNIMFFFALVVKRLSSTYIQIFDGVDIISHRSCTLEKGISTIILPPPVGK